MRSPLYSTILPSSYSLLSFILHSSSLRSSFCSTRCISPTGITYDSPLLPSHLLHSAASKEKKLLLYKAKESLKKPVRPVHIDPIAPPVIKDKVMVPMSDSVYQDNDYLVRIDYLVNYVKRCYHVNELLVIIWNYCDF